MDNVLLRFPHLGEQIFKNLEDENLAKCHQLSRTCRFFIEDQKFVWIRVIKKLCDDQPAFIDEILMETRQLNIKNDSIRNMAINSRKFCKTNLSISRGQTLLHFAAMSGEEEIVKKIIKYSQLCKGQKFSILTNPKDNRGRTPLHFAAKNGHLEVLQLIWKDQTTKRCKEKNPEDHMGLTPLHFAAQMGHIEICKFILKRLKQIDSTKMEPLRPLHLAAENGHLEVCKLFIKSYTIRDSKSKKMIDGLNDKNPRFKDGKTPLHLAAKEGHLNVCKFIIEKVEDKNPKDNRKDTPLHIAAEKGHLDVCELIIGQFSDKSPININPLNLYGETPLQNAFLHRHHEIYQLISQALGYSKRPNLDALVNESLPKKSRTMIKLKLDQMEFEEDNMDLRVPDDSGPPLNNPINFPFETFKFKRFDGSAEPQIETRGYAMEPKYFTERQSGEKLRSVKESYGRIGPRPGNAIKAPMEVKMMGSFKVASPKFYFMGPHVIDPHSMASSGPKDMMKERRRQQMMMLGVQAEPNEPDGVGLKDSPFLVRKQ